MEDTDCPFYMGKSIETHGADTNLLDGVMDEVRVSNSARSEAWINTTYQTVNSFSEFISTGVQQTQSYSYLNISIQNNGSHSLQLNEYSIMIDGNATSYTQLQPYHYPDKNTILLVNISVLGARGKMIKCITENGVTDTLFVDI